MVYFVALPFVHVEAGLRRAKPLNARAGATRSGALRRWRFPRCVRRSSGA